MRIRSLRIEDAAACVAVSATVGWTSSEARWRRILTVGEAFGAEDARGALAGTVILNRFDERLATVAMMAVVPQAQRGGVGRELMGMVLAHARDAIVYLYATDAGRRLYERTGFVDDAAQTVRFEGRAAVAMPAHPGLREMKAEDFAAVCAIDAEAQGASRAALLRTLSDAADRAFVVERGGAIVAFGLATPLDEARLGGPIVARGDHDTGALAAALTASEAQTIRIELSPGESALAEWARGSGLATVGTNSRMVHGGRALPGRRSLVRAMAGRAYG
jgi:predicted N-acetyltransferase YhbS